MSFRGLFRASATLREMAKNTHFDYLVLGGGSGGIASCRRAAMNGAKAALIDAPRFAYKGLGGTCVNVGCVPKKVMFNAAMMSEFLHDAGHYGFDIGEVKFSWPKLKEARDKYIVRLNGIYDNMCEKVGAEVIRGYGKFTGPKSISVDGVEYTGDKILIATGGSAIIPDCPGSEHGITSDGFFELEDLPKRAVICGAGYIAVELAGILKALGSEVTLVIRKHSVLRSFDITLQEYVMKSLETAGINIVKHSGIAGIKKVAENSLDITLKTGEEIKDAGSMIFAIGRKPNTDNIDLDKTGVETDEKGYIKVDKFQETNVKDVFALGDDIGKYELTPVAIKAGRALSDRLFKGMEGLHMDYSNIPTVVFSHPPMGTVGLTEQEARDQFGEDNVKIFKSEFVNMYHSVMPNKPRSYFKAVCTGENDKVRL
uniref:Glutathione-disulfide reductase n=1 Tax=Palpitomonas bilix TaxID=652834 RepID=A0A7S3DH61_9EUKA|mmetsp:Transcript_37660/g.97159  ORF Transcript_37660/g.97159 Transcript_37660/m.97159 type:complete len:427 (+) Transcript_37660:57-1337(+)